MDDSFPVIVTRRESAGLDSIRICVKAVEGTLPTWEPGAHVDVHVPGGEVRQYSLSGIFHDPDEWTLGVLVEREGRGGSRWLEEYAHPGAVLRLGAPRNHFGYSPRTATRIVFIAGGIGVTPILPMIGQAIADGADWELHFVGRSLERMAFLGDLAPYTERVRLYPRDVVERPDLGALLGGSDAVDIYCCGPEPLMAAVEDAAREHPRITAHVERFVPRPVGSETGWDEFEVVFDYSGITTTVTSQLSILDAAEQVGIDVPTSCREGTCGTCETPVMQGSVVHLDSVLSDAERAASATMMICISRAACPRLVLDL